MTSPCPDAATLRGLLDGALAGARLGEVEDHVEHCIECQGRLARLSGPRPGETQTWLDRPAEGEESLAARLKRQVPTEFRGRGGSLRTRWSQGGTPTDPAPSEEVDRARLIEVLAEAAVDFEILEEVGRGGMGVVYKARDRRIDRLVAIKIVRVGVEGSESWGRFRREAFAAARLQHPNIIQLFDVGEDGRAPYLIMEYIAGPTLGQRLREGPLALDDAVALTETLARAIDYAHGRGIVHRDLKPSNVLIGPGDVLKVADFGLAKLLNRPTGDSGTRRGALIGTPHYMSPEQAKGESATAGPAADVYALGVIFYEMLTGTTVFHGASPADIVRQVREAEPIPPSQRRHGLPPELDAVCLRCLQKDPQDRFASAADLADELGQWREHRTVRTRLARTRQRGAAGGRSWLFFPLIAALVLVSVLCGILGYIAFHGREGTAGPPTVDDRELRDSLRGLLDAPTPDREADAAARLAEEPGASGATLADDLGRLARAERRLGRAAESREALGRAADVARRVVASDAGAAPGLAHILMDHARAERDAGAAESARESYEGAIAWLRRGKGSHEVPLAEALLELADELDRQPSQSGGALALIREAVDLLGPIARGAKPDRPALLALAEAESRLARLSDRSAARMAWGTAVQDWDRLYREDPSDLRARRGLADGLEAAGELAWGEDDVAEAVRVFDRARGLRGADLDPAGQLARALDDERCARALARQGRPSSAAEALDRGARLLEQIAGAPATGAVPPPGEFRDRWLKLGKGNPAVLFGAACYLASLWEHYPERDRAEGEAALQSVLSAARRCGFSDFDRLKARAAFAPFGGRPWFAALSEGIRP